MTLEEIRILAACLGPNQPGCESCDAYTTGYDDMYWECSAQATRAELAALLVRAVEALGWLTRLAASDGYPAADLDMARSLLRELGVEV